MSYPISIFTIKVGDTAPAISAVGLDINNNPVNLSGATAKFYMSDSSGTLIVNGGTCAIAQQSVQLPTSSSPVLCWVMTYSWGTNDISKVDTFQAEFEVTYSNGAIQSFPQANNIIVQSVAEVDQ